jgi:hypothetical protein
MGYNITKTHLKHTSFDDPMSVDRQQRNISTPQHEMSFHRVQRLQCEYGSRDDNQANMEMAMY